MIAGEVVLLWRDASGALRAAEIARGTRPADAVAEARAEGEAGPLGLARIYQVDRGTGR